MIRTKLRKSAEAHKKFARYRLFFALSLGAFLAATALEMILFGAKAQAAFPGGASFRDVFVGLATGEGILYLSTLLLGVTVYAPAVLFLAAILRGVKAGFALSSLLPAAGGKAIFAFVLTAAYLFFSALWYLAYASFCTCVSLKIFSAHAERCAAGEERLFGGSLFYAEIFCGSVNTRFLFTYTLFFFASLAFQLLLSAGWALARTRLF